MPINTGQFKIIMIVDKGNPISVAYGNYCTAAWMRLGFQMTWFHAITPETLGNYDNEAVTFGKRGNGIEMSETEKACFMSQYMLWKKCAMETAPMLILEHDALPDPVQWTRIMYLPGFMVQFFGQHAMEAVMINPRFARRVVSYCAQAAVSGPMNLFDHLLGYSRRSQQSRFAMPHARFQGYEAPVKSIIDPKLGTTVAHPGGLTSEFMMQNADLFIQVDLEAEGYYTPPNEMKLNDIIKSNL